MGKVNRYWVVKYVRQQAGYARYFYTFGRAKEFSLRLCRYCKPCIYTYEGKSPEKEIRDLPDRCDCCRIKVGRNWQKHWHRTHRVK